MPKYLVFKNQPDSGQANVPGSREEMACIIAQVVTQFAQPRDFYIAYPLENPHSTWESIKESAQFSVEIDDERAALLVNEILPLADLAENINEAIGDAYGAIVDAAQAFDHACEKSKNFQDVKVQRELGIDRAFDVIENGSSYEVAARAEEIFEVESFHHYHA